MRATTLRSPEGEEAHRLDENQSAEETRLSRKEASQKSSERRQLVVATVAGEAEQAEPQPQLQPPQPARASATGVAEAELVLQLSSRSNTGYLHMRRMDDGSAGGRFQATVAKASLGRYGTAVEAATVMARHLRLQATAGTSRAADDPAMLAERRLFRVPRGPSEAEEGVAGGTSRRARGEATCAGMENRWRRRVEASPGVAVAGGRKTWLPLRQVQVVRWVLGGRGVGESAARHSWQTRRCRRSVGRTGPV